MAHASGTALCHMHIMPTLQLLCACMLTEVVSIKIHAGIDKSSLCMYLSSMYAATAQSFIISSYMYVSYFTYITNKLPNSKQKVKYVVYYCHSPV